MINTFFQNIKIRSEYNKIETKDEQKQTNERK